MGMQMLWRIPMPCMQTRELRLAIAKHRAPAVVLLTMREYLRVLGLEAIYQVGMVLQHRAIRRLVLLPISGGAIFHEIGNE